MLVLMTLSDLERRDLRGKIFRANLLYTVWSRTTKFCRATHMGTGERHISRSQLCPLCKRAVPQFSQFEGFFLFMLFNAELPNLTWSHIWGACFRGTASPHPNGCFLILGVLLYSCEHPLSQDYRIWSFDVVTHILRGLFSGAAMPHPNGGRTSAPQFGGSLLFMCTPFVVELPNLTW